MLLRFPVLCRQCPRSGLMPCIPGGIYSTLPVWIDALYDHRPFLLPEMRLTRIFHEGGPKWSQMTLSSAAIDRFPCVWKAPPWQPYSMLMLAVPGCCQATSANPGSSGLSTNIRKAYPRQTRSVVTSRNQLDQPVLLCLNH